MHAAIDPRANSTLVDALGSALLYGGSALGDVPILLRKLLEQDAWKCFETQLGKLVTHKRFETFVTTAPLDGLGSSLDLVERIISDDPVTLTLFTQAKTNRQGQRTDLVHNGNEVTTRTHGNERPYALRKLWKSRPDLHAEVLAGEKSPHAAMVEAGFRRRTITVPIDVAAFARTARKHFNDEQLVQLVELLED